MLTTVKVGNKEFSLDERYSTIKTIQNLAERCYQQGRSDKWLEITSNYLILTEEQVNEIREVAIDEFVNVLLDGEQNDEFIYSINQIAEQLKGGDN